MLKNSMYIINSQTLYDTYIYVRWTITATRGGGGNFPCGTCLVPREKLAAFSERFERRDAKTMDAAFESTRGMNQTQQNEVLREYSLRPVKVNPSIKICSLVLILFLSRMHSHLWQIQIYSEPSHQTGST